MRLLPFILLTLFVISCHQNANSSSENSPAADSTHFGDTSNLQNTVEEAFQRNQQTEVDLIVDEGNSDRSIHSKTEKKIEANTEDKETDDISIPTENSKEQSQETASTKTIEDEPSLKGSPKHDLWDELLQKHVNSQGIVDYKALKNNEKRLDEYLNSLRQNPVERSWSGNEKMAYWINTYNAFTVKLILKHYPVSSIMNIENGKAWDLKWIKLGNAVYSLNQIENEILRPIYKDARIHFAVNCAARSCPPLWNRAFTAENLEESLKTLTRKFINDPDFNQLKSNKITVSRIFDWYKEDFDPLIPFLNRYSRVNIQPDARIAFKDYDWSLNGK